MVAACVGYLSILCVRFGSCVPRRTVTKKTVDLYILFVNENKRAGGAYIGLRDTLKIVV